MSNRTSLSRRQFLKTAGIAAGAVIGASSVAASPARSTRYHPIATIRQGPIELVHWSWLIASDGEVWQQMIDAFNEANTDIKIVMSVENADEYNTKVLAGVAAGNAPDFGWGTGGLRSQWIADGVLVGLDDLIASSGLDIADFTEASLRASRYPKFDNQTYMIPMDAMSLQMEVNTDHVAAAGLDISTPPNDAETLLQWAEAMTVRDGDTVTRSGIMMTGSGVQPTVTWGIVSHQMGFRRASDDLTTACVNPEAGAAAMQWVLDLFDTYRVSTRDVTDRYRAFGAGEGSTFWTGPWTVPGYLEIDLPFATVPMPAIGGAQHTYFELGGLELYTQTDPGRYAATMEAIKWLSDNSFLWTTVGRGAAVRNSILEREDYNTAGSPWEVRGAFVEGMAFADILPVPVLAADDFEIYSGGNFLANTIASVIAGEKTIEQMMEELQVRWQAGLDAG